MNFLKRKVYKKALFIEGLVLEEHSQQNCDQNPNLPDGYPFEGVDFGFKFDEFGFKAFMSVAVDCVFEIVEAFYDMLDLRI